jgi:hypothetical protein
MLSAAFVGAAVIAVGAMPAGGNTTASPSGLPVMQMERALHAKGTLIHGVLSVEIDRNDITDVHIGAVPIKPAFEINGDADFQPLANHQAFLNGDLALKSSEIDPFISALLRNGITFQAEHQHMYDYRPIVWFIHFRAKGNPVKLAGAVYQMLKTTSTPLPQAPPSNPQTPFNPKRLQTILHGYDAEVGDDGVVTVYVARRNPIFIDGIRTMPETNIATNVAFEPLNKSGTEAAVISDFGMEAGEIDAVVRTMRSMGWDIGCLYNQETDEHPQLFFSHEFKTGNPYTLAAQVREGLNHTNSQ